jgi:hypothetical protein
VKTPENIFQWNSRVLLRMENEGMIVAIRTPEITGGEEKH